MTMRLDDFREMVRRLSEELPSQFLDGIAEVTVSPRTVPHPDRAGIYTLGECVPLPTTDSDADAVQSRIVLYHGSFAALAHLTPSSAMLAMERSFETAPPCSRPGCRPMRAAWSLTSRTTAIFHGTSE